MLNRLLIAILGIPVLAYIYYHGGIPLLLFVNLLVAIGLKEFYEMAEKSGNNVQKHAGILFGTLIPNIVYLKYKYNYSIEIIDVLVLLTILLMVNRVIKGRIIDSSKKIGVTLLGIVYVAIFFSYMILISILPNGGIWLLTLQVLVWVCDSCAYFVGIRFGRKFFKKDFSKISPKKSIEGSIGGTIFTVSTLVVINKYADLFQGKIGIGQVIIIGILISYLVQIGDLIESMFKREFQIKDSSRILGEHGGILDRFDSLIFVLPIVYYVLKYWIQL